MPWVYILHCRDRSYYVGSTTDLERRIAEHQSGEGGVWTACRLPVELVYCCEVISLSEEARLEKMLKSWRRRKKEALIAGRFDLLPELSRSKSKG